MKKVNLNGKLSLKKETIAKLNDDQMNVVKGGWQTIQEYSVCAPSCLTCGATCNINTGATCAPKQG